MGPNILLKPDEVAEALDKANKMSEIFGAMISINLLNDRLSNQHVGNAGRN